MRRMVYCRVKIDSLESNRSVKIVEFAENKSILKSPATNHVLSEYVFQRASNSIVNSAINSCTQEEGGLYPIIHNTCSFPVSIDSTQCSKVDYTGVVHTSNLILSSTNIQTPPPLPQARGTLTRLYPGRRSGGEAS